MNRRAILLGLGSLALLLLAPLMGSLPPGEAGSFILWQLRVPRVIAGAVVGSTLSLVGAAFQALFGNPLATPSTVGTTAGGTLGALAALVLVGGMTTLGYPTVALAAFVGGASASFAVSLLAATGRARMNDVLLGGIAITLAASACAGALQAVADQRALFAAAQWSLGHLPQVGYGGVRALLIPTALTWVVLFGSTRGLQTLVTGSERARTQGLSVRRLRTLILGVGSLGVSACVALCGPIAFVGLVVPHLVRLLVGARLRIQMPLSWLSGAAFLVSCDALARLAHPTRDLPVGVITAGLGAPALVLLVMRRQR
jgi:iron complex transport system permease protein